MQREDLILTLSNQLAIMRALWITSGSPISDNLLRQMELTRERIYAIEHDHRDPRR